MSTGRPIPSLELPAIAELAGLGPRFVTWRLEPGENGKPTKVPYRVFGDVKAATDAPATWGSFEEACAAIEAGAERNGIGFIPRPAEDGILAIDLDGCIDPRTGEVADWAQRIVDDLDSYTEISPSWAGLKIFVRGTPVPRFAHKAMKVDGPRLSEKEPQIELLGLGNRYTTLSGQHFGGTPLEIHDATDALLELAEWMSRKSACNGHDRPSDHASRAAELRLSGSGGRGDPER